MNAMKRLIVSILLLSGTSAYCESEPCKNRDYYDRLHRSACDLYDKGKYKDAMLKWHEVYQWSRNATNEVLRYKSIGNMLFCEMERLERVGHVSRKTYHDMMTKVTLLESVDEADIPDSAWGETRKERIKIFAADVRSRLSVDKARIVSDTEVSMPDKTLVANTNPYEMPVPWGMFRGLGTAVMSPCNIFMAWPISLELGGDLWVGPIPLVGSIFACGYVVKDALVGVADIVTLGWAGHQIYDAQTSPWWWERFGGKTKAAVFR